MQIFNDKSTVVLLAHVPTFHHSSAWQGSKCGDESIEVHFVLLNNSV